MTQFIAPGFQVGDRAFTSDGREGTITASRFNDDGGFWEHLLDPIFEFFPEFELSRSDTEPPVSEPEPVAEILIPPPEEQVELVGFVALEDLRELVLGIIESRGGLGVQRADLDAAIEDAVERSNLIAQGNLLTHIAEVEALRTAVGLESEVRFLELESTVTTTLSEIEKRDTDLEALAEEESGGGFLGFVGGLGGLIKNPVDWIMSRLNDHILSEVNDGLNR